jgi:hypothetical protein
MSVDDGRRGFGHRFGPVEPLQAATKAPPSGEDDDGFMTETEPAAPATIQAPPEDALERLRAAVGGVVLTPEDQGYDAARAAWNPLVEQFPAVIVVAGATDDVVEAVRFARSQELAVAVQATGHGVAAPADGSVLIVTSGLRRVRVDPVTRTAIVAAGARWSDVLAPALEHGLTGLAGSSNDVGVVGYTLGGGLGWLARRYGLASDAVLSIDLVTPDGLLVTTSPDRHPEIFWALKGGGAGLLGVVVAMEIELVPVPFAYAGTLSYPVELAWAVVRRWRDWVADARPELTSQVVVEPHAVSVRGCWSGDAELGAALVDEWRRWSRPLDDDWVVRPADELERISYRTDETIPNGITNEWLTVVRDEVVDELVAAATDFDGTPPRVAWAGIRHAGGAIRARSEAAVNGAGRHDAFLLELCGGTHLERTAVRERLRPFVTGATFLNLVDGHERRERTSSSFTPAHLDRLRAVKLALDPEHRFRHGIAIEP